MIRPGVSMATFVLAGSALAAQPGSGNRSVTIQPGESCPPGMTEIRPRNCQAPTLPLPSILDYRPRSTLKAPAHSVPKAKYPAIDFHGHPTSQLGSAEELAHFFVFLCSDKATYSVGSTYFVDGGMLKTV